MIPLITLTAPVRRVGQSRGERSLKYSTATLPITAVSRKTHNLQGTFDVNLPLTGTPGIECRTGGASNNHLVVVTFPTTVTVSSASVTMGTGSVSSATVSGNEVFVNLTGVTNAQTIQITLFGVNNGATTTNVVVPMSVLLGDTNANKAVNSSDVTQTKGQTGTATNAGNFRTDVNVNGAINSSDISTVKSKSGTALPP
jgi:Dockerin type I domain